MECIQSQTQREMRDVDVWGRSCHGYRGNSALSIVGALLPWRSPIGRKLLEAPYSYTNNTVHSTLS